MPISACMIVRDEAKLLERCIRAFDGGFDELIIVDTGAVDDTLAIAKSLGARTPRFTECTGPDGKIQHFAMARNVACDLASADWILWMDADDVLQPGGANKLREAVDRGGFSGLQVTIRWNKDSWLQTRVFKNVPTQRFVGRVHEYPRINGKVDKDRSIEVQHLPDKTGKEGSVERNLRLMRMDFAENPKHQRTLFHLGNALRINKEFDEAIARYADYLELGGNYHHEKYLCAHYLAVCLFQQKKWREAIDAGLRAVKIDPRYAEAHCLIADCYGELREYGFSRQWYLQAIACAAPPADSILFVDAKKYDAYPKKALAICDAKLAKKK
ncbi:MAG: glycosyltransferase [Deltaproteobacteria bacterium]|nr:glycosyltransferase [Deltaproteobacteria bacterium]